MNDAITGFSRRAVMAGGLVGIAATTAVAAPDAVVGGPESPDVSRGRAPKAPWTSEGHVRTAGGRIHWVEMGSGPPVVLLPKLGGWIADWRHVAPMLAPRRRVIVIDPPGHGDSRMDGPPPFLLTQEESAGMIMKTLDTLGVETCAMVGNSMGGSISLVAAVLWPDRVSRVAMVTTALPGAVPLAEIVSSASKRDQVYDRAITFDSIYQLFGATRETYDDYVLSEKQAGVWKDPSERGVRRAGLIDYLSRVKVPAMIIYGDRAGLGYQRYVPEIVKRRPDIPIVHIANSGTFTHQDNPAATAKVLQDFLG